MSNSALQHYKITNIVQKSVQKLHSRRGITGPQSVVTYLGLYFPSSIHVLFYKINYSKLNCIKHLMDNKRTVILIGIAKRWQLNRGLIYHSFPQVFWRCEY